MDQLDPHFASTLTRRRLIAAGALGAAGVAVGQGATGQGPGFPGKTGLVTLRARPPLLETPLGLLGRDVFTPNDRFFVRWHWADIPTAVDVRTFRLRVGGHVAHPQALTLADILAMPRIQLAAVNQCSGNSRSLVGPRVAGAQWGHGAMGNARWVGVPLRHILDRVGVRPGAVDVRFGGLDKPLVPQAPDFLKSLAVDHARDGEVMVAFQMNGEQLPLLNGFPLRLIVPGWFSTYWVKALDTIEVLARPDDNFWMAKAYRIPTAPHATVVPGAKDFPTVPINAMPPRSWVTSLDPGQTVAFEPTIPIAGLALGGAHGVAKVDVSSDGRRWYKAVLGPDHGRYSFRRWDARVPVAGQGPVRLMSRCWNTAGEVQPFAPVWNPGGYARNQVEVTTIVAA
ncbi:molybdopterin-dependent oxidoreductase [Sphingomonas sp.]|uniref:molybdopterin-dependent oxidoreductase n=1 Tax=Sphingomonas sp. TaxID=28214 RepID=UPI003B002188